MKSKFLSIIVLLAVLLVIAVTPTLAQDDGPAYPIDTITVVGSGSAAGTPDIATIEIGVESRDSDLGVAFSEVNATIDGVIDALVAAGVAEEDIRTVSLNVYQERPMDPASSGFGPEQSQPSGEVMFVVNNIVRVTVRDIDGVAEAINAAVAAGATNIFGLNFGISDRDALESEAREEAMANARARAEQLAALAGVSLGDVVVIDESFGGSSPFDLSNLAMARSEGFGGASIEPGQLSVTTQVRVTYRINR